jgi:hypothetical protein
MNFYILNIFFMKKIFHTLLVKLQFVELILKLNFLNFDQISKKMLRFIIAN